MHAEWRRAEARQRASAVNASEPNGGESASNTLVPGVTLALVGDMMLGHVVDRMIAWGDILPAVRGADGFFINLECALTDHTERWSDGGHKPFYFRANPRVVETLQVAGVDFAAL